MNKLIKAIKLTNEGYKTKDKIILLNYFIKYFFSKIFRFKVSMISKNPLMIKNSLGLFYCGNSINNAWIASSFHEPEMNEYFKIKKGVFIDVGANIGKYSVYVGNQNKYVKIVSIEPEPDNFKTLKENIRLNQINNTYLMNVGAGSTDKEMDLYLSESTAEHSLKNRTNKKIKIKVRTLDSILKEYKIQKVDLIKIDVEGAEKEVLLGAKETLKNHPKIIFEARTNEELKNIKKFLDKFGYKIKKIFDENYIAR